MINSAPTVWGPHTWELLHLITIKPTQDMSMYTDFFYYLRYVLPCKKCQRNYTEHVYHLPIPSNKKDLAEWLIKVHNRVNQSIDKTPVDVKKILKFWQEKYKEKKTLAEILTPVMYYFINSHPGYYKTTPEFITAHEIIWKNTPLFFSHLPDASTLQTYLLSNPPPLKYKEKYLSWFKKMLKDLHLKVAVTDIKCAETCTV